MKPVRQLITEHLKYCGYDGLCTVECGCSVDDLAPCDAGSVMDCTPAYRWSCAKPCPFRCNGCLEGMSYGNDSGCYRPERQP